MEPSATITRIQATRGWVGLKLHEVWEYRELLYFLVWRDLKVRYKQTALGAAWAVIQPFFTMLVFSIFFGRLAGVPSDGYPYSIFVFTALVPWQFFANGLMQSSNSLVGSQHLITKVYFPRLVIPIGSVFSGVVDFLIALLVLLAMAAYYGFYPGITFLAIPLFFLLALISALGAGLWLSALNVEFRDVRYVIPFLVQFWLFASPIAYPSSLIQGGWRVLFALNPMVAVVDGFRWGLLGAAPPAAGTLAVSVVGSIVLLISGAFYFRRMERGFADVV